MPTRGFKNTTEITTEEVGKCLFGVMLPSEITVQALLWTTVLLVIVAVTVNGCTLFGLKQSEDHWTPRFVLLKNLILCDVLLTITQGPTVTYCLFQRTTLPLGNWCFIQYFLNTVCIFCSLLTITCMAMERYLYVCHAIHYMRILTFRRMCVIVGTNWLLSLCVASVTIILLHLGRDQDTPSARHSTFGLLCEPDTLETSLGNPRAPAVFRKLSGFTVTIACLLSYAFSYLRMYQDARNAVQPFQQVNRRARKTVFFYCAMLLLQLLPVFAKIISDVIWELEGAVSMVSDACPVRSPSPTAGSLHIALVVLLLVPPCINPLVYVMRNPAVYQC
ncbi:olfactory receptor 2AG1-like [Alosa pseudoharengus]|uniref:olfactory receptor 2AG1-like n=1 Tax=Alosa pseudoharengus TaxID=34774 RepID=UPI003F8B6A60